MHDSFLKDVALVLGVAALTSSITHRLRLPSVLGYLIAGLIIGPYIPIPLFADPPRVQSLSEFGVILVMFSVGMEFRLKKFFKVLPTSGVTAAIEVGAMFLVGVSLGYLFDWSPIQSLFLGGALSISSTMLVSKVFEEDPPSQEAKEHVLGILVIQDFVAIVLLTIFGAFAIGNQLTFGSVVPTLSKLIFTLSFLTVVGLFFVPKFIRHISSTASYEVLMIVATGICFVLAALVESLGYSVALGSFLAGILVAESGEGHKIEELSKPMKDVFVAIFFVSVGMTVDPVVAFKMMPLSIFVSLVVVVSQLVAVFGGSVISGAGMRSSLYSALALGQIGEFSFIITAIGVGAGVLSQEFQAVIVTVSILTSLSTPMMWKNSHKIVAKLSRIMPSKLRIAIGLYETWFQKIRGGGNSDQKLLGIPKRVFLGLIIDSLLLILLPPLFFRFLPGILDQFGISNGSFLGVVVLFVLLAMILSPIFYGFTKITSSLIIHLSARIFPVKMGLASEGASVEKFFKITIWAILCLIVGFPFMASISIFVDNNIFVGLVILTMFTVMSQLWRSAGAVAFEFETGGEKIVSVLKKQTFVEVKKAKETSSISLPGLDNLESVSLENKSLLGKLLGDTEIQKLTGVKIISIEREEGMVMFPSDSETIIEGDIFHIWGTPESKLKFKEFLTSQT